MSTNNHDERAAIETLVNATIGTSCPIVFENALPTVDLKNKVWVRCTIQPVRTDYAAIGTTVGTRMRRTDGFINIQVMVPENKGTEVGIVIADIIQTAMDSQVLTITNGQIRLGVTNVEHEVDRARTNATDTGRQLLLCVIPFQRDVFG